MLKLKKFRFDKNTTTYIASFVFIIAFAVIGTKTLLLSHAEPVGGPTSPPVSWCENGLQTSPYTSAPSGAVTVPAGDNSSLSLNTPNTTYWFASGTHTLGTTQYSQIDPGQGDTYYGAPGAVINGQYINDYAFDASSSNVTIEYLTIEDFIPPEQQAAVGQNGGVNWTIEYDEITSNVPGAGVMLGTNDNLSNNCLSSNGQYGFQAYTNNDSSSLTGGPSDITVNDNDIAYNNICNVDAFSNFPVTTPSECKDSGGTSPCGCSGGAKFWQADGAEVDNNYVHDNYDIGLWADTDNNGFQFENNYISNNFGQGLMYEISYNALIEGNTFLNNAWGGGINNPGFPTGAIYISESGGDSRVPNEFNYSTLDITNNTFTNNWSGVVLWENSDRFCGPDSPTNPGENCTLVDPSEANPTTCVTPGIDNPPLFNDCRWKTQNVSVNDNIFNFTASAIGSDCTTSNGCGYNALFSEYGVTAPYQAWVVPKAIANNQNNVFSDNTYNGAWVFMAPAQGATADWSQWSQGYTDNGDGSGIVFNAQDAGSTMNGTTSPTQPPTPVSPPSAPTSVSAKANSATSVTISWNAAVDSGGPGIGGYYVLRNGTQIATVNSSTLTYADDSVASSTTYSYTIEAYDTSSPPNVSQPSTAASVTTPSPTTGGGPTGGSSTGGSKTGGSKTGGSKTGGSTTGGGGGGTGGGGGGTGGQIVEDKTFEDGTDNMTAWYNDTVAQTSAKAHNGSKSLGVTGTGGNWGVIENWPGNASVTAGTTYDLTSWALAGSTGETITEQVIWISASGSSLGTVTVGNASDNSSSWNEISGSVKAPNGAVTAALDFVGTGSSSGAVRYLDDVEVTTPGATSPTPTPSPSAPTNVSAKAASSTSVNLSWTASTDTGGPGIAGYYVIRNGVNITPSGISTTSYTDNTVASGTSYTYTIESYDKAGNVSAASSPATVQTPVGNSPVPPQPTGLVATAVSSSQINLSWSDSATPGTVVNYYIYRNGIQIASVTSSTSYGDTGLKASTTYSYYVVAYNTTGKSAASNTAIATTQATSTAAVTLEGVVTSKATGLPLANVYVHTGSSFSGEQASTYTNSNGQYVLTGMKANHNQNYIFSVSSYKSARYSWKLGSGTTVKNIKLSPN